MRALDILLLSLRQLKERRLRTVLTVLAIAVGVTSIVALSAQVEGVKQEITQTLQTLGPDTVIVTAGFGKGGVEDFTDADVVRLKSLEGVSDVIPMTNVLAEVTDLEDPVRLVGITSSHLAEFLGEIRLLDGNIYYDAPAPQALIGYDIAVDDVGESRYKVGQPILVQVGPRSIMLTVVGILDVYGSSSMVEPEDSVFISMEYVKTWFPTGGYTIMVVKAESSEEVEQVTELIGYVLGGSAHVMSVEQITETVTSVMEQLSLFLLAIAATSFIAAGLGTFNIMMISVLERVREIGILKALGTKDKGVLTLYITQGLLLGFFGSLTGLSLGSITAYALPVILGGSIMGGGGGGRDGAGSPGGMGVTGSYTPVISSTYLGIATAMSIAVTLLSSAYPAWKASRLSPVEALRYE